MIDLALKNITRQKTRTILTVLGILIGIGAIVALGSIAEGIDSAVQNGLQLTAGKITVIQKDSGFFGMMGSLSDEDLEAVESVSGIKDTVPILIYAENIRPMHTPDVIVYGIEPSKVGYFIGENTYVDEGRMLDDGETDAALIGSAVHEKYGLLPGDSWTVKDTNFEIVGVLEETGISDIDSAVIVNFEQLRDILKKDSFQMIYVIPEDVSDTERIAEDIEDASDNLDAMTTKDLARQASQIVDQIRIFTFAIGAISAFVGGLGVMNTMIMAVMERRKEIGIMKAIGATNSMVLRQILTESALISVIGGLGGIILGIIASFFLSNIMGGGSITAVVTPQLALTGLGFALVLGIIGGLYPARKASTLDPVEALRYE